MFTIQQYVRAQSLDEAYALNQKKSSTVLGGCGWLRMGRRAIGTAIDLSDLGLDQIIEHEDYFELGAMVTLRQMETNDALAAAFGGCIADCVRPIVGVQFRGSATIGGSIWSRFGFSDPLTLFLALGARVRLHQAGEIPLAQFVEMPYDRDILISVILPKDGRRAVILSHRASATDLPALVCAAAHTADGQWLTAVGARPHRAALVSDQNGLLSAGVTPESAAAFAEYAAESLDFQSNMRGSAAFRAQLCRVLVRRAVLACAKEV